MRFPVMIRRTRTGYSADVPDLPGCIATAKTIPSIRRGIAKAIAMHLELMAQAGEKIPKPGPWVEFDIDGAEDEELGTWGEVLLPQST